jgi:hypothetical protein
MNMKKWIGYDLDDLFESAGLQRRRPFAAMLLPAFVFLACGAAVGAGVGLMFAPSSGRRFRREFGDRFEQIRERVRIEAAKRGLNAAGQQQQAMPSSSSS